MIHQGVRMLFVVNTSSTFEGLITSTDVHGERQMRLVAERGIRFDELTVGDVMTGLSECGAYATKEETMSEDKVHVSCPHCLTTNRVPMARLADDPTCGRCGQTLLDGRVVELTDANFEAVTSHTDMTVLVDFWAPWCGPCKMMGPQFDKAAAELKGKAMLAKVNSDDNPATAGKFVIRSIPTLIRLKGGREVARQSGAIQAPQIVAFAR